MQSIMKPLRENPLSELGVIRITGCKDYDFGIDGLPKYDVLKYFFEDNSSVVIRPSGTEPELKAYISTLSEQSRNMIVNCVDLTIK